MTEFTSNKPCDYVVGPDERGDPLTCGRTPTSAVVLGLGGSDPTTPGDLQYGNFCEGHYAEARERSPMS